MYNRIAVMIAFTAVIPAFGCDINNSFLSNSVTPVKKVIKNSMKTHELLIFGEKLNGKIFAERIAVRNADGSDETEYKPDDTISIQESGTDLMNSWSPNGKFLLLPRGRFEGFTVFTIEELPHAVSKGTGKRAVAIKDKSGIRWWHEFDGWMNDTTIRFRAGLSSDLFKFELNVENGELRSLDLKHNEYQNE